AKQGVLLLGERRRRSASQRHQWKAHQYFEEGKRKREKQRVRWKRGGSLKREGVRGRTGEEEAERERVDAVDEWDTIAVQTKPEKVQRIK
ncbi:hypothetical protein DNTS_033716, partial [Danionella cerebrum]